MGNRRAHGNTNAHHPAGRELSEKMKQLKVAMDDDLRAAIEKVAKLRGVSLADEIRERLWESFGGREACKYIATWLEQVEN